MAKKKEMELGNVKHIRLRKTTEDVFAKYAKQSGVPLATYIRFYIEDSFEKHKDVVKFERSLINV